MARKNTAYKVSDETTYQFTNFNGAQGSVVEQCITERATLYKCIFEKKIIPHFTGHMIPYLYWD